MVRPDVDGHHGLAAAVVRGAQEHRGVEHEGFLRHRACSETLAFSQASSGGLFSFTSSESAHERTRTSTGKPPLEPESSASTNSAT